jgi:hypothetical protein
MGMWEPTLLDEVVEDGVVNLLSTPWEQEVWFTYVIYIKVD